jgi:hypothetical protein
LGFFAVVKGFFDDDAGGVADVALAAPSGGVVTECPYDDADRRRFAAASRADTFAARLSSPVRPVVPSETRSRAVVLSSQARGCAVVAGFGFTETPPDGRFATTGAP